MIISRSRTGLLLCLLFLSSLLMAQDTSSTLTDTACVDRDLTDLIRKALKKPPKEKKDNANSLLLIPIVGSNPATGFMVGLGGQYAFKMPKSTQYSTLSGSVQYTTKNQFLFLLKNNVYSRNDRIFYSGDWRLLIFSQSTYGLGTNAPKGGILEHQYALAGSSTEQDSLEQPMEFNFIRLHQSMSFKVKEDIYVGLGYYLDGYSNIVDKELRLDEGDTLITSHYAYNTNYKFNIQQYYSSALNFNVVLDTRDNMINAYKGVYAKLSWRGSLEILGSERSGNFYQFEWRSFHGLSERNPKHLVAFWLMGDFSPSGEFPYMILPATAYDQRGRSARGYTQGRFRGNNFMYGEVEYRFPISPCGGVLGGVLFANATTASAPEGALPLFGTVQPSYGAGLRVAIDKQSRTSLAIDVGFGNNSTGFYLAAAETF